MSPQEWSPRGSPTDMVWVQASSNSCIHKVKLDPLHDDVEVKVTNTHLDVIVVWPLGRVRHVQPRGL